MILTRLILERTRLGWLFFFLIFLLGVLVYQDFPSREEPLIRIPRATVITSFPGLPPEQVEDLISRKLEEKFREIGEIKHLVSYSQPGLSIVEVHVHEYIPDFDVVWDKLRRKVEDAKGELPEGVIGPYVNDEYADISIVTLALTGEDWEMSELRDQARQIRDRLYSVEGIRRVSLYGVPEQRVFLEVDPSSLEQDSFSIQEAVRAIRDRNKILPAGEIITGRRMVTVETSGKLSTMADLNEISVRSRHGEQVLPLAEYVDIRKDYVQPPDELVYYDGKPALILSASMLQGHNVKAMGPLLREFVAAEKIQLPVGMELEVASLQPEAVEKAIAMVSGSLYQTLGIVLAVVILALGFREGILVGCTVPLTLLAALLGMYLVGVELHFVSLASLIISLGMLVDNGIVITEDMRLRLDKGAGGFDAAMESSRSLALPLLTSTLTTVLAFSPILFVNTTSGEFSRSMAQVVGITLLCSWFVSVTFVPLAASKWLRAGIEVKPFFLAKHYSSILKSSLKRPYFSLLLVLLLTLSLQALIRWVPTEMFPVSSRPEVLVYVDMPAGYNVFETERTVETLNEWLLDKSLNPGVESVSSYIGTGGPRISLSIVPNNPAPHRAFMVVKAVDAVAAGALLAGIREFSAQELSEAMVRTELISRGITFPGVVELRFSGPDADVLYEIARKAETALANIPDTLHVRNNWENRTTRYKILVDQARAYRAGVSYELIANSLNAKFSGGYVSELRQGDTLIPIVTRAPQDRSGVEVGSQMGSIKIPVGDGKTGDFVTLDQVASFEQVVQFGNIIRLDLVKTITVSGKHLSWDSATLQGEWDEAIDEITRSLPHGYRIELGGELEQLAQSSGPMLITLPILLGLVLCVLVAQFNSIRRTGIVFITIPLAISGGVFGLYVSGVSLDFIGMLGFLSLAGIVINHAIVLIDRAEHLRNDGSSSLLAIEGAALHRLRPICITSVTTILGLIPLVLMEEVLFRAMAIVIMSGLAVGTCLTLVAVPALYLVLIPDKPATSIT